MNRNIKIIIVCLSIFLTFKASEIQSENLNKIFEQALNEQNLSVENLLQIKNNQESNYYIDAIIGNIQLLRNNLDQDKQSFNTAAQQDNYQSNQEISLKQDQLNQLRERLDLLRKKLDALQQERSRIRDIYSSDTSSYVERRDKQTQLKNYVVELIEQVEKSQPYQQEGVSLLQEKVFAEIKSQGKGNPIMAMAQLARIFSQDDKGKLLSHLHALQNAIEQTLAFDLEKENQNLSLYGTLTHNLDNVLIPNTQREIEDIQRMIAALERDIAILNERVSIVSSELQFAQQQRNNMVDEAAQAVDLARTHQEDLRKSETLVKRK